ncbi:MAG: hypothetical protein IH623_23130 [Verrucomicrobia bacterium]|nr:hypothetical protein [Verrucomicrobiota bacterium]
MTSSSFTPEAYSLPMSWYMKPVSIRTPVFIPPSRSQFSKADFLAGDSFVDDHR